MKNVEARVRDVANRPELALECVPRVRLERRRRQEILQSCPGPRRRLVSHPSAMLRASPGMITLCRDPKNMSLQARTTPPAAARSI